MRNTTNDETNIEKGSDNSEEDAIPDFVHDVNNMVSRSNVIARVRHRGENIHPLNFCIIFYRSDKY